MSKSEDAQINAAIEVLIDHMNKTRRNVLASRITGWSIIVMFTVFLTNLLMSGDDSPLALLMLLVSAFGLYQAVRVLRTAKAKALAVEVFEKSLEEAYARLRK